MRDVIEIELLEVSIDTDPIDPYDGPVHRDVVGIAGLCPVAERDVLVVDRTSGLPVEPSRGWYDCLGRPTEAARRAGVR